jgi:hypothetical protein
MEMTIVEDAQLPDEIHFEDEGGEAESTSAEGGDRTIRTKSADPEIESLYNKWKRGKLVLQPGFQRQYVWDRAKASRLIESVLLAVPLPIIYLAEELDNKESVIDGQQRLTTFFSFLDGKFPAGEVFKLSGLRVFHELNGKAFKDLEEGLQDAIRFSEVRVITILKDSDSDLKFEIFERLNTGSVPLNDMELRNCIYRGPYMELLRELSADADFRKLLKLERPDRRMKDIELVLRFAAFYHGTYLKYQAPMRRFLNRDMETHQQISASQATELRQAFKTACQVTWSLFGERSFRRFSRGIDDDRNGSWEPRRFNASLYDVTMGVLCQYEKNRLYAALDSVREALIDLMASNDEFIGAILLGTSEPERVRTRFDLVRSTIEPILKDHPAQDRCFSQKLKQELFDHDPTCAICAQQISGLDDAAVDHVEQYWRGGQTIPENARLTHRYCNWSRSRNE